MTEISVSDSPILTLLNRKKCIACVNTLILIAVIWTKYLNWHMCSLSRYLPFLKQYFWCIVHLYFQVERPTSGPPSVAEEMDSGPPPSVTSTRPSTIQSKRRKEFYLSSVPISQTSTQNTASQVRPSSPIPPSQPALSSQRFYQLRNLSQASQPKKKSRMGF